MPVASKSICSYPGCNRLTISGTCERHRNVATRKTSTERGYDSAWTKCRNAYIRQHPVCELQHQCDGDPAAEVDHIIPLPKGPRLDWNNLQSLCRPCHSWKTRHVDGRQG